MPARWGMASWDPGQYARFADERARPFHELVARIPTTAPVAVVDLGCGPGTLTATLATRYPDAAVLGIDSSPQMLAAAAPWPRRSCPSSSATSPGGARSAARSTSSSPTPPCSGSPTTRRCCRSSPRASTTAAPSRSRSRPAARSSTPTSWTPASPARAARRRCVSPPGTCGPSRRSV
ncbi:methyltransferase domain-containing protein [Dactylosporangium cerinum]